MLGLWCSLISDRFLQVGSLYALWFLAPCQVLVGDILYGILIHCVIWCIFYRQERVQKMILFIGSLASNSSQPFLIISDSSALPLWEAEFSRLDSSIDVVVYSGKEDSRRIIRTFEFYEEGGCIMFQVLLSPIEALVEVLSVSDKCKCN